VAKDAVVPGVRQHVTVRRTAQWRVLGVIAVGGGLGALARYGVETVWPSAPGGFPWATFVINATGCLLIGALMVLVTDVFAARPLLRPFVGVGVLGGFTTFSTYANEVRALLRPGTLPVAFAYLAGTLVAALLAVVVGMALTTVLLARLA
jgi:CrcB protein